MNISGRKKPYDNSTTRNLKSKQKRGNFMKVKLKKHKKSPAPAEAKQALRKMLKDTSKPLPFITDKPSIYDFAAQRKMS